MDRHPRRRNVPGGLVDVSGIVYGVHLRGRLPRPFRPYVVAPAGHGAEPAPTLDVGYRVVHELPEVDEVWSAEGGGARLPGRFAVFRLPGGFGLTVSAADARGVFRCTPRAVRIEWTARGTGAAHHFFSYALPLWLETEGVPVLHGSAVSLGGRAVAFLGPTGVGKSVLCAELLRLGFGFVADDALALRRHDGGAWRCFHGPPLLRLWPSGLEGRLAMAPDALPRVHESLEKRQVVPTGERVGGPAAGLPLAAVYVLQRRAEAAAPVRIGECRPRDALVRLLEHGVAAAPAAALGLSAQRLDLLADVAGKVPVRLLRFPSSPDSAARVRAAIEADLEVPGA